MISNVEYYYQKTKLIALATFISAILNLILNAIFIKFFGYCAAGYTTLVSYICLVIMHYIFYHSIIKNKGINNLFDIKKICLMSVCLIGIMFVVALTYNYTVTRYGLIIFIAVLIICNRIKILEIINGIKE